MVRTRQEFSVVRPLGLTLCQTSVAQSLIQWLDSQLNPTQSVSSQACLLSLEQYLVNCSPLTILTNLSHRQWSVTDWSVTYQLLSYWPSEMMSLVNIPTFYCKFCLAVKELTSLWTVELLSNEAEFSSNQPMQSCCSLSINILKLGMTGTHLALTGVNVDMQQNVCVNIMGLA